MSYQNTRTHFSVIYVAETEQFLSEKTSARGGVMTITLTSDGGFAAKNLSVYDRKGTL